MRGKKSAQSSEVGERVSVFGERVFQIKEISTNACSLE